MARVWAAEHGLLVPLDGGTPETPPGGGTGGGGGITPPPPGGTGMLVGASVSRGRPAYDAIRATAGPWSMSRTYNKANMSATFAADPCGADVGKVASVFSSKPDLAQMASGAYDALVRGWALSIPTGHPVFPCIWHEPDVKLRSTSGLDVPLWTAATDRYLSILAELALPHLYPQLIFTNWSLIGGVTVGQPDTFWQSSWATKVKCVGWDLYDLHNSPITTSAHELKPCRDWCDAKGLAWGIAEIGIRAAVTDHSTAITWLQDMFDYARTTGAGPHGSAAYFAMFDYAASAPNTPLPSGDSTWAAWSATNSAAHYLPYTTFTL
jgi:hypothetical protein